MDHLGQADPPFTTDNGVECDPEELLDRKEDGDPWTVHAMRVTFRPLNADGAAAV